MISTLNDFESSTPSTTPMSEATLEHNTNELVTITNIEMDMATEDKQLLSDHDNQSLNEKVIPIETSAVIIGNKQKSLVSVYDNSNDSEQQLIEQQQQQRKKFNSKRSDPLPLVGIIGRSQRAKAFRKRLILSGFPTPVICDANKIDIDVKDKTVYVSHETFYQASPTIILITDNLSTDFEHLLHQDKQYLIVDAREIIDEYLTDQSSQLILSIPGICRAFGNLSNWEIENGCQRVSVAVEQGSPTNLIKLIHNLDCFSRGIRLVDPYSYSHKQIRSFHYCLFPLVSTIIIVSLCSAISIIENGYHLSSIYRQASSISASTSITLLAIIFLLRPKLELLEWLYSLIENKKQQSGDLFIHYHFFRQWLQSRRYMTWYALSFALLHLVFLTFSKLDINATASIYGVFLGIFTLVFLIVLSFVFFPWISERLLWREYHLFTAYIGPCCLLIAFIHVFIHWRYEYRSRNRSLFTLKFVSLILPGLVLILRLMMYGIIIPITAMVRWLQNRSMKKLPTNSIKETSDVLP